VHANERTKEEEKETRAPKRSVSFKWWRRGSGAAFFFFLNERIPMRDFLGWGLKMRPLCSLSFFLLLTVRGEGEGRRNGQKRRDGEARQT
jgi:hypothetical protein